MKRNVFAEISEGFDALKAERAGKVTLRSHVVKAKAAPAVSAKDVVAVRKKLNL